MGRKIILGKSVNREVCSSLCDSVSVYLLEYVKKSMTYDLRELVSDLVFMSVWRSVEDSVRYRL
jgi:hypothetical protein